MYIFRISKKHTRRTRQIYSKLVIKAREQHLLLLLLTLAYFTIYSTVNIAEIKQIDAGWARETVISNNKLVFIVLWIGKICWAICFHLHSPNVRFQKDKCSLRHFKKIN